VTRHSGRPPLSAAETAATASAIEAVQLPSGLIPWYPGGPADPWNHVEAAMALDVAGRHEAAAAAYDFLAGSQRADGSLPASLLAAAGEATHVDTNAVAYVAAGLLHHTLSDPEPAAARRWFGVVEASVDFVCRAQRPDGALAWSVGPTSDGAALLAASSSVYLSLGAALRLAASVGANRPDWATARRRVRRAIVDGPAETFLDKDEFAMDWYYPVLSGALAAAAARRRIAAGEPRFVVAEGVRCRSDRRWITTAETAECAIAYLRVGESEAAGRLLSSLADKRRPSGGYLTGLVHPERSEFPAGEESTYSAAAVLLAADALRGGVATGSLFAPLATSTRRLPSPAPRSSVKVPEEMASR